MAGRSEGARHGGAKRTKRGMGGVEGEARRGWGGGDEARRGRGGAAEARRGRIAWMVERPWTVERLWTVEQWSGLTQSETWFKGRAK